MQALAAARARSHPAAPAIGRPLRLGATSRGMRLAFKASRKWRSFMLRAAIAFFIIALLAMFFGMNNIAGISADLGKLLLFVFLALAVVSFIVSLVGGRRSGPPL
jgi:uncharacterized membrane protein YtjA (UPF0391 family)